MCCEFIMVICYKKVSMFVFMISDIQTNFVSGKTKRYASFKKRLERHEPEMVILTIFLTGIYNSEIVSLFCI